MGTCFDLTESINTWEGPPFRNTRPNPNWLFWGFLGFFQHLLRILMSWGIKFPKNYMILTVIKHIPHPFSWGHKFSMKRPQKFEKYSSLFWRYQSLSHIIFPDWPAFRMFKKSECTTKQSNIVIGQMLGKLMLPKKLTWTRLKPSLSTH